MRLRRTNGYLAQTKSAGPTVEAAAAACATLAPPCRRSPRVPFRSMVPTNPIRCDAQASTPRSPAVGGTSYASDGQMSGTREHTRLTATREFRLTRTIAAREALASSASDVARTATSRAISTLRGTDRDVVQANWLAALGRFVLDLRPDIGLQIAEYLGQPPTDANVLHGLTIGDLSVVYEALLALSDHGSRKNAGQFFTPDDVAEFMAAFGAEFDSEKRWIDPCCGVGNLAWHLSSRIGDTSAEFIRDRLVLVDRDPVALKSAVAIMVASFAAWDDKSALPSLAANSYVRDFLSDEKLPEYDFAILNPPYARSTDYSGYTTAPSRDLYAFFFERILRTSKGYIAITPASFLTGGKYSALRELLDDQPHGGKVFVFDNVPDTCFRGFKFGSTNTSKTNFVRAAVTVSHHGLSDWTTTPILRWASASRARMFANAETFLTRRRKTSMDTWVKLMPGSDKLWDSLSEGQETLLDLTSSDATTWRLDVASTPRYYISASTRMLDRSSKHVLYFRNETDLNTAYAVLNSSLAYWWWRSVDGGITLSRRALHTMPIPAFAKPLDMALTQALRQSDEADVVSKLNAGRQNENVRRSIDLRRRVDETVLGEVPSWTTLLYAADMFCDKNEDVKVAK